MTPSTTPSTTSPPSALVSGAGFAGLATAFWMNRLGYRVTLVETAVGLKRGGTPVDIRDETVEIVRRMGILPAVRAAALPPRATEFRRFDGTTVATMPAPGPDEAGSEVEYEIPRDDLLRILLDRIEDDVTVEFGNAITGLTDTDDGVRVSFRDGSEQEYALVLGCEGNHSAVRRMRFGPESDFTHFLGHYFSVAVVRKQLIEQDTTRLFNEAGRAVMLNSYEDKTDIVFSFHSDREIAYDRHDEAEQRRIVHDRFAGLELFADLLVELDGADNFYFDKLSQIRMPTWSDRRVALVGDAAYCASPAAGMGGSLALIGASALHDAFERADGDVAAAFEDYERALRPVVERVQDQAVEVGVATYFPATEEALDQRDAMLAHG